MVIRNQTVKIFFCQETLCCLCFLHNCIYLWLLKHNLYKCVYAVICFQKSRLLFFNGSSCFNCILDYGGSLIFTFTAYDYIQHGWKSHRSLRKKAAYRKTNKNCSYLGLVEF